MSAHPMWNVELHCHTYWSKDSLASPRALLEVCRQRGIDRLAVTDHNTLRGGLGAGGAGREGVLRPVLPQLDALEPFNARTPSPGPNARAAALARQAGLPGLAGSDAHAPFEVGRGLTVLEPFHDAESFRRALASARLVTRRSPAGGPLVSRYPVLCQ